MYIPDEDDGVAQGVYTVDEYNSYGYRLGVRANGTAYVEVRPGQYREFRTEAGAKRWTHDHMKLY